MAHSEQTLLQLSKFEQALATLKDMADDDEDQKTRDSTLLRFVYTFEMAWQAIRAVLRDKGDTETPRVAFAALETGFRMNYITDAQLWKELREARNAVSHAYDEPMAVALAAVVRAKAIPEFERLLQHLQSQS